VPIGESTFLLPKSSEITMEGFDGTRSRNVIQFSRCRQYSGESTLSFAEVPEGGETVPPAPSPLDGPLPGGLMVDISLGQGIKFPGNSIGDEVEATVTRNVKRKGVVVIPKGAVVKGNIVVLEKRREMRGQTRVLIAIHWRDLSFDGKNVPFEGQLESGGAIPVSEFSSRGIYQRPSQGELAMMPHRDVFYVRKETLDIPRGLPLMLRTMDPRNSGTKKP
jgi:hypothetical protein